MGSAALQICREHRDGPGIARSLPREAEDELPPHMQDG